VNGARATCGRGDALFRPGSTVGNGENKKVVELSRRVASKDAKRVAERLEKDLFAWSEGDIPVRKGPYESFVEAEVPTADAASETRRARVEIPREELNSDGKAAWPSVGGKCDAVSARMILVGALKGVLGMCAQ
jgi:hypothetical protein